MENLNHYETILVAFSGGKDSLACLLHLFDLGLAAKVELWHHEIDGREGSRLMDWPCTPGYCKAVADAFDIPIYFSWREGGFEREMLRQNQATAPVRFETPEGVVGSAGGNGPLNTRRKFPQVSANLSVRYCSSSLKIDVMAAAIRNQERFRHSRTLVVTGERAEESKARSNYPCWESHRSDARNGRLGRHIDHWRPIHDWSESQVWEIIERWRINPDPAYYLGFSRCSCLSCIFGNDNQWASIELINPAGLKKITSYEHEFGVTIHRTKSVPDRVANGTPYPAIAADPHMVKIAMSEEYTEPIRLNDWRLPPGAFGESSGPT